MRARYMAMTTRRRETTHSSVLHSCGPISDVGARNYAVFAGFARGKEGERESGGGGREEVNVANALTGDNDGDSIRHLCASSYNKVGEAWLLGFLFFQPKFRDFGSEDGFVYASSRVKKGKQIYVEEKAVCTLPCAEM